MFWFWFKILILTQKFCEKSELAEPEQEMIEWKKECNYRLFEMSVISKMNNVS